MLTISANKADVGSIGGHTQPSERMMAEARERLARAMEEGLLPGFDASPIPGTISAC